MSQEELTLKHFVTRLRDVAGANLESVVLFGSSLTGDFHSEFSNLNLFCVVRDTSFTALQTIAPAVKWWNARRQPPPLFMTRDEVERSTDVFTIELIDVKQHHRLLFGEDIFKDLYISASLHRVQVEYELREKLLLLRQHLLLASGNDSRMWELLIRSVSSFATLLRHALMVLGYEAPMWKRQAIKALAEQLGFDSSPFLQVLDVREKIAKPKQFDVADVFARYLTALEQVTAAIDKMLDSGASSSS